MTGLAGVDDLVAIVGSLPDGPCGIDWDGDESELGITLPRDYKEFIERSGVSRINGISVAAPAGGDGISRSVSAVTEEISLIYEGNRAEFPDAVQGVVDAQGLFAGCGGLIPIPFHPGRPGLVAWGEDLGGANIYWLTEGEPYEWPVVVDYRDDIWERHDMSACEFLVEAVTGRLDSNIIKGEYVAQRPVLVERFG
ncbi:hypothetical protein [Nocardiopsis suaedae]|uniref:SMI1/KNR4 family protein n=1 Tax=Nocardiopsis suaedae TaxID=3018444 RepID=A0ABT4TI85_9ACTN|nr:hypothetical protein [Nocardiopsis suaedae]MDA2804397.1 hypothetical protein [Nocardiopsis suaedae]